MALYRKFPGWRLATEPLAQIISLEAGPPGPSTGRLAELAELPPPSDWSSLSMEVSSSSWCLGRHEATPVRSTWPIFWLLSFASIHSFASWCCMIIIFLFVCALVGGRGGWWLFFPRIVRAAEDGQRPRKTVFCRCWIKKRFGDLWEFPKNDWKWITRKLAVNLLEWILTEIFLDCLNYHTLSSYAHYQHKIIRMCLNMGNNTAKTDNRGKNLAIVRLPDHTKLLRKPQPRPVSFFSVCQPIIMIFSWSWCLIIWCYDHLWSSFIVQPV